MIFFIVTLPYTVLILILLHYSYNFTHIRNNYIRLEWTTDNFSDVSLLLSQCDNVYSAEVPTAIKV